MRLKPRRRIGMEMLRVTVDSETIERTGPGVGGAGKITAVFARQWMKAALRLFDRALFQYNIDILRFGRPYPEMCLVRTDQFGADGITPFELHTTLSPLPRVMALRRQDLSFHLRRQQQHADAAEINNLANSRG